MISLTYTVEILMKCLIRHRSFLVLISFAGLGSALISGCAPPSAAEPSAAEPGNKAATPQSTAVQSDARTLVEVAAADSADPTAAAAEADSLDWPFWRGPENNGISRETGLIDDWDPRGGDGSNAAWVRDDLGGRSTPVVLGDRLYTIVRADPGTSREGERVVCVDTSSGETVWENRFNVWLSDVPDTRVGWSSCVADPATGRVYALGACGYFQCIDGATGDTAWSVPLHETFGLLSTYGGRTNFPVICDDLVIISGIVIGWGEMAKPAHRFLAFDKATGEVVWFNGTRPLPYDTNYSSPTITVLDGQKAMVVGSGDGAVWALQPRTGKHIWKFRFSRRGLNVSPLVADTLVYAAHSEENIVGTTMGAVVAINAIGQGDITSTGESWRADELMVGKSSPVLVDGRLYCFDDRAKLHILDADSGQLLFKRIPLGTVMRSSPLYADGKLYAVTANGRWYILEPDDNRGVKTVSKGRLISGDESHASPICAHGRIFLQTTGRLYCLADADKQPGCDPRPSPPVETPLTDDTTPAHVQVVPAEALMRPGTTLQYNVRLFNARGQFLQEVPAEFTVEGVGDIDSAGGFTAPDSTAHSASTIHAHVGSLTGSARVRIVPDLPWEFDFEDVTLNPASGLGQPTVTWVGARYRHVVRQVDGNQAMVKITTIPKGARSRCWFGHPGLNDYTIQADVRGSRTNDKMPDIGITAQGYALDMQGANQQLQIRTWGTQLRMATTIPFPWEPDKWYTMKLKAFVVDGRGILQGKVWPRGDEEPDSWTIEAEDSVPNLSGSPGLFGSAKDAEIFLDNIKVTAN